MLHAVDAVFLVLGVWALGYVMGRWSERRHTKPLVDALTVERFASLGREVAPKLERLEVAQRDAVMPSLTALPRIGARGR